MPSLLDLVNKPLITAIGVPLGLGMSVGLITRTSVKDWYPTLKRPSWTPPNWVFPVAWTSLYISMGLASHRIYRSSTHDTAYALQLYAVQLGLNLAWTPLFFGAHLLGAAVFDVGALFVATIATTAEFFRIDETAGWLMVPYAAWIAYAGALTVYIYRNNPKKGGEAGSRRKEL
ncbi:hypothetical protein HKX48_005764 [Thoreauomyces humboldtii]|nr:hypothetical protein HKX48_005764 [Thoreauomyces humboldtii]